MNPPPEHTILRVVEEIDPDELMSAVIRRMVAFKRAGVSEYWTVDSEARSISVYRLRWVGAPQEGKLPPDWTQIEEEFFGTAGEAST
jgi:Uma2 family endonuclease